MFETFYGRPVECQCGNLQRISEDIKPNEQSSSLGSLGVEKASANVDPHGVLLPEREPLTNRPATKNCAPSLRVPISPTRQRARSIFFALSSTFYVAEPQYVLIIVISKALLGGHLNWAKTWSRSVSFSPRAWESTKNV